MNKVPGIAITVLSVVITFIGVEGLWRFYHGVQIFSQSNFIIQQLDIIRANVGVMVHDKLLGWRLKDNIQIKTNKPASITITTGTYGIRMNSDAISPLETGGVLAVGDSFTAGSGVDNSESWPAQLERLINVPVFNAAAGAWGVDQMVLRAEQLVPQLRPTVLIVGILGQDSLRNAYEIYGGGYKPYFEIQDGKAVLKGVPVPEVSVRPMDIGTVRRLLGHSYFLHWVMMRLRPIWWIHDSYRYKKVSTDEDGVKVSCLLMERLMQLRESYKLRIIVMMQYGAAESSAAAAPWYGPPVLACAREQGFETIDTYAPLHALSIGDSHRFVKLWLDEGGQLGHMSAAGNAFIAGLIRDLIIPNHG